jgi:hypothetical protein
LRVGFAGAQKSAAWFIENEMHCITFDDRQTTYYSLTEYGNNFIILYNLNRPGDDETQRIEAFALVENDLARSAVNSCEVNGEFAQTAFAAKAKCWIFGKHSPVEVKAQVAFHILRTVV